MAKYKFLDLSSDSSQVTLARLFTKKQRGNDINMMIDLAQVKTTWFLLHSTNLTASILGSRQALPHAK